MPNLVNKQILSQRLTPRHPCKRRLTTLKIRFILAPFHKSEARPNDETGNRSITGVFRHGFHQINNDECSSHEPLSWDSSFDCASGPPRATRRFHPHRTVGG